jgi:prevent-host-death family protein
MITRSISEARRQLGALIELARQGEDVVIIKDSKPVVSLRPVTEADLELVPEITDAQAKRILEWDRKQPPGKKFDSPEAAARYIKKATMKKEAR